MKKILKENLWNLFGESYENYTGKSSWLIRPLCYLFKYVDISCLFIFSHHKFVLIKGFQIPQTVVYTSGIKLTYATPLYRLLYNVGILNDKTGELVKTAII